MLFRSYGADAPLGLTVQYSGNGLWGRDYPIDGPTHIRFAVVPHRRAWDAAGIQEENRRWNEPLLCTFAAQAAADEASLIDAAGTGYEISAAYLEFALAREHQVDQVMVTDSRTPGLGRGAALNAKIGRASCRKRV